MSHFTVLVIGDEPSRQMERYDEGRRVEPYKTYIDTTERAWEIRWATTVEARTAYATQRGIETPAEDMSRDEYKKHFESEEFEQFQTDYTPSFDPDDPDRDDLERIAELLSYGGDSYEVDEVGLFRWTTYNPDSKWDWYSLGGRWLGFFMVKDGVETTARGAPVERAVDLISDDGTRRAILGRPGTGGNERKFQADQLLAGDVDWDSMRQQERKRANAAYDEYEAAIDGTDPIVEFDQVLREHGIDPEADRGEWDQDALRRARDVYNAQERIVKLREEGLGPWLGSVKDVWKDSREEYVEDRVQRVAIPYAVVRDGEWLGKGDMGWWGMSSNEMDQDMWFEAINNIYAEQDPNTLLTLLDCHI